MDFLEALLACRLMRISAKSVRSSLSRFKVRFESEIGRVTLGVAGTIRTHTSGLCDPTIGNSVMPGRHGRDRQAAPFRKLASVFRRSTLRQTHFVISEPGRKNAISWRVARRMFLPGGIPPCEKRLSLCCPEGFSQRSCTQGAF